MGYQEENELHEDSFSKAICSIKTLARSEKSKETSPHEEYSIPPVPFGMFEMAKKYDIVKGRLAGGFFEALGPPDGRKFKRLKERIQLLQDKEHV
jgi:hypothetical protein